MSKEEKYLVSRINLGLLHCFILEELVTVGDDGEEEYSRTNFSCQSIRDQLKRSANVNIFLDGFKNKCFNFIYLTTHNNLSMAITRIV